MTKEVYEALKTRIEVTAKEIDLWHWHFKNDGLNEGYDCMDDNWIDAMCQDMRMHRANLWNIAERVYGLLRLFSHNAPDLDDRLIANPLKK